jgi:hypothetical protein
LRRPLPASSTSTGRRHLWRDLAALRRAQATPPATQPTLFELRDDSCPAGERSATERYQAPSLFTRLSRRSEPPGHGCG